uniref:Enoyl reductase (ER) domain-containing protein n=1 Tax=Bionectria ochroleuca TaxID=29856 RepID=A0A0B7JNC4_BIOOC
MADQATIPPKMKAVLQPDKTSHNLISSEITVPIPTHPEDVLVRVHATSPCKGELDWALWAPEFIGPDKTPIPGQDLAGTVVSAPCTSSFKTGDRVYARINANRPGCAAEYVLARESELAIKPKNLNWVETAATPISALTGYQGLFTQGTLDKLALKGDNAALEKNAKQRLAREAGVKNIIAVVGERNVDYVKELGASETIAYTKQTIGDWVKEDQNGREVDLVFDCAGGSSLAASWYAVKDGGKFVSVCGVPEDSRPKDVKKTVQSLWFVITPLGKDLDIITEMVEAGRLKVNIDSVFEFDQFSAAFEKTETGRPRGKVILKVSGEV